jgi:hypothetical protein
MSLSNNGNFPLSLQNYKLNKPLFSVKLPQVFLYFDAKWTNIQEETIKRESNLIKAAAAMPLSRSL